jgi:hypothetical protein
MNIENALTMDDAPVQATEIGLCIDGDLSFEQWRQLGHKVGRLARTSLFLVGDWIVYGQNRWNEGQRFEKLPAEQSARYIEAMQETGLELRTLMDAAYVARNVPLEQRRPQLTFEHHKTVAKVKDEHASEDWLKKADTQGLSTRRLRKSIMLGHVARDHEMRDESAERGIDNHIPWVNGIVRWWKKFESSDWIENATREQLETVVSDFNDVQAILNALEDAINAKETSVIDV